MDASVTEAQFGIVETSTEERYRELESFYQDFKKIYLENPKISKKKVYEILGYNQTKERRKYVNQRIKEDGLPIHFNTSRLQNMPNDKKREEIYQRYKELFETTDISLKDIRKDWMVGNEILLNNGKKIRV